MNGSPATAAEERQPPPSGLAATGGPAGPYGTGSADSMMAIALGSPFGLSL